MEKAQHTEILHELPPMLIDIALVVAAAADDAVPVAAISIVVEVPISISICDMSISAIEDFRSRRKGWNGPRLGGLWTGMGVDPGAGRKGVAVSNSETVLYHRKSKTHGQSDYYEQQDPNQSEDPNPGRLEAPTGTIRGPSSLSNGARTKPLADCRTRWGPHERMG